jgi:hypothetical protein
MSVWTSIGGAICVAVAAVGLVISWVTWRKSGAIRGMRAIAWSLLPLVAYLTGAVRLLGTMVSAIVRFAGHFVFSPKSWAGVIVLGLAVLLFLSSGGLPLLNWRKARERRKLAAEAAAARGDAPQKGGRGGRGETSTQPAIPASRQPAAQTQTRTQAPAPVRAGRGGRSASADGSGNGDDDDMSDVEDILRRRGIN